MKHPELIIRSESGLTKQFIIVSESGQWVIDSVQINVLGQKSYHRLRSHSIEALMLPYKYTVPIVPNYDTYPLPILSFESGALLALAGQDRELFEISFLKATGLMFRVKVTAHVTHLLTGTGFNIESRDSIVHDNGEHWDGGDREIMPMKGSINAGISDELYKVLISAKFKSLELLSEDRIRQLICEVDDPNLRLVNPIIHARLSEARKAMAICLSKNKKKIKILIFATNPHGTSQLRLDEEVRSIQEMIRKSEHRDYISFESRWAVRPLDLLQAINELNPDIIHFSGHGAENGNLILENDDGSSKSVTPEAIRQIIGAASHKIHIIVFNACFSYSQAKTVTEFVDAAIGMNDSISDMASVAFAAQFYSSIGFGLSVQKAFDQAKGTLMLVSPEEEDTPSLYIKEHLNGNKLYIITDYHATINP